jgi:DNA segregation ATPase FtsK/SpoIIIE-like protein
VIGVLTALSPLVTTTNAAAAWTMVVLGVVLAATSLWSLAVPGSVASEWVHGVLGVLLFLAPWVMGYSALTEASWTSWVAGVLAVVVAASALPAANAEHRTLAMH